MSMTDPIADMLARVRNASTAFHDEVEIPASKIKENIARILVEEGYVDGYERVENDSHPAIKIALRYSQERQPAISGIRRISKPGRRVYARKDRLPRVLGGMGVAILSTSQGLLTARTAEKEGVGGEVICFVW